MRPIKFRAWDKKRNFMHVDIQMYEWFQPVFEDGEELDFGDFLTNEERFSVMQFTGLLDKNGKEIYEGDILSSVEGQGSVEIDHGSTFVKYADYKSNLDVDIHRGQQFTVIGNVHENPELLK